MASNTAYTVRVALIVALGGFLMGFDASVISGVVGFIGPEFDLTNIQVGWAVASLTLTATIAMMLAGPISDRFGRRPVLFVAALLFTLSAVASALAPDYLTLVIARMVGGFGVGAALIIAPMYIDIVPNRSSPPAVLLREAWREGKLAESLDILEELATQQGGGLAGSKLKALA